MWWLLACAAETEAPSVAAIASPIDGATLSAPIVPVLVHLPEGWERATVRATIDGAPADDPFAVLRPRNPGDGDGVDWLAAFDPSAWAPGPHRLDAEVTRDDGARLSLSSRFTWAPPPGRVDITVVDGAGLPVSARIVVHTDDGRPHGILPPAQAVAADPSRRDRRRDSVFAVGGRATVWLEPGAWRLYAVRGVRDEIDEARLVVDGPTTVRFTLPRAVATPGEIAADLHVHTARSPDCYVPDRLRYASLAASGLDVAVITDHNDITDPAAPVAALLGGDPLRAYPGIEVNVAEGKVSRGHVNAFPTVPGDVPPRSDDIAAVYDAWRDRAAARPYPGSAMLLQLNHPRGIQFDPGGKVKRTTHALWNREPGYDRQRPPGEGDNAWMTAAGPRGTTSLDFDALEVMNRFSLATWREVREDWFALLRHGYFRPGTGNSDSHALSVERAGLPANFVDTGGATDAGALVDGVRAGRVRVSTGPLVDVRLIDAQGAEWRPGDVAAGRVFVARVTARAASWVPVDEVRLVIDGRIARRADLPRSSGPLDVVFEWPVDVDADAFVLAEAGWPLDADPYTAPNVGGLYAVVAPEYAPVGFTNPVRIDADGDGRWKGR